MGHRRRRRVHGMCRDRLDLFMLALLLHDTGKGRRSGEHTVQSVELADSFLARLDFDAEERMRKLLLNLHLYVTLIAGIFVVINVAYNLLWWAATRQRRLLHIDPNQIASLPP